MNNKDQNINKRRGGLIGCLSRWVSGIDCSWGANKYDYAEIIGILALLLSVAIMICLWIFVSGFSAGVWLGVITCKFEKWVIRPLMKFTR